jgi:hypothetical protein
MGISFNGWQKNVLGKRKPGLTQKFKPVDHFSGEPGKAGEQGKEVRGRGYMILGSIGVLP